MRELPSPQLIALLERLGLANAKQVGQMGRRVRGLARDLPRFDSVWIGALAQARILTPLQAARINAARGESLRVGPYLLCSSLRWPDYVVCYRACRFESQEPVQLAVVENPGRRSDEILSRLQALAAASGKLSSDYLACVTETDRDGDRIWAASPWIQGRSAAEWMVLGGRFPPEVVLQIARTMLSGLGELEKAGLCHGDVSTSGLLLTDSGGVVLLQPGMRGILRPEEGYAHADLPPEAFDSLAPERITKGTPPTIGGDMYACGCVWWHLLCGRPPLAGGDSLAKLRSAQAARVFDVRRLAPEVPMPLACAISACLDAEPSRRPESMARLAATLGAPTRSGQAALVRCLARSGRSTSRAIRPSRPRSLRPAALAGCLLAAAAILWPLWHFARPMLSTRQDVPHRSAAQMLPNSPPERRYSESSSDKGVVPANYETDRSSQLRCADAEDLVLDSDGPVELESLQLQTGQCVRGKPSTRPVVMVPQDGLVVRADNVRFENIDFVHDHPTRGSDVIGAVVHLRSARAEFRGCSFRSAGSTSAQPAAIRWTHPDERSDTVLSLPSGRVQLSDCVLQGVAAGVDCRTVGALAVELANSLHLGRGPLVRLDHCPKLDEPVLIALSQMTLRDAGPLLECRCAEIEDQPGEISIQASRCVFVPEADKALLLFVGPKWPQRLLGNMRWTGQGSLVSVGTVIAAWHDVAGHQEELDDASVSIAGLVRSKVGFSGKAESGSAASQIIRWQAPLRSADPPGIDASRLPEKDTDR